MQDVSHRHFRVPIVSPTFYHRQRATGFSPVAARTGAGAPRVRVSANAIGVVPGPTSVNPKVSALAPNARHREQRPSDGTARGPSRVRALGESRSSAGLVP